MKLPRERIRAVAGGEAGTLGAGDVAVSSLSILASILPGIGILGKTIKGVKAGTQVVKGITWYEGKAFLATTYSVGVSDALVQGYILTDSFIEAYDNLPTDLSADERSEAVSNLVILSLAYGFLISHSIKSDIAGAQRMVGENQMTVKNTETSIKQGDEVKTDIPALNNKITTIDGIKFDPEIKTNPLILNQGADGNQVPLFSGKTYEFNGSLSLNSKTGDYSLSLSSNDGGNVVKEQFKVTQNGVEATYTRDQFLQKLGKGDFNPANGEIKLDVKTNDPLVGEAITKYTDVQIKENGKFDNGRALDEAAQTGDGLKQVVIKLDAEGGHSYADHGAHTTEAQHLERLRTGRTPGGEQRPIPNNSSKFLTDELHLKAYNDALTKLEVQKINTKGGLKLKVEIKNEPFPNGGISYSLDAKGNLVKTTTQKYTAIFRLNADNKTYKLVTLFPE